MNPIKKGIAVERKEAGSYSFAEQCSLSNVNPSTLWRWIKNHQYPQQNKLGPRRVGCPAAVVNEYHNDPEAWRLKNAVQQ